MRCTLKLIENQGRGEMVLAVRKELWCHDNGASR